MGGISEARLGAVIPVLDRYRPVAITAAAILAVVLVLPGAEVTTGSGISTVPTLPFGQDAAASTRDDAAAPASTVPEPELPAAPAVSAPAPAFTSAPARTESTSTVSSTGSFSTTPEAGPSQPLTPTRTAWATQAAGTPIGEVGVPEGSLPVGARLGQPDKASFAVLQGTEPALVLQEHADGTRGAGAVVQACVITDAGWEAGGGQSFDDAPAWDPEACVPGARSDSGEWRFEVATLGEPDDPRGYALVPGPDAPPDFQVAFTTS